MTGSRLLLFPFKAGHDAPAPPWLFGYQNCKLVAIHPAQPFHKRQEAGCILHGWEGHSFATLTPCWSLTPVQVFTAEHGASTAALFEGSTFFRLEVPRIEHKWALLLLTGKAVLLGSVSTQGLTAGPMWSLPSLELSHLIPRTLSQCSVRCLSYRRCSINTSVKWSVKSNNEFIIINSLKAIWSLADFVFKLFSKLCGWKVKTIYCLLSLI